MACSGSKESIERLSCGLAEPHVEYSGTHGAETWPAAKCPEGISFLSGFGWGRSERTVIITLGCSKHQCLKDHHMWR